MSERISCAIIKDLMPSYLDAICSEASKELVDSHVKVCPECRKLLEEMQKTEIVAERIDTEEMNYMKKVKRINKNKNLAGFGVLMYFLFVGIFVGMCVLISKGGYVPELAYQLAFPVLCLYAWFVLSDFGIRKENKKWRKGFAIASLLLFVYNMGVILWSFTIGEGSDYPFGMEPQQVGPFFSWQYIIIAFLQLLLFVAEMMICFKKEEKYPMEAGISLMTVFLSLSMNSVLHNMDTAAGFIGHVLSAGAVILIEGISIGGILALFRHWPKRR